MIVIIGTTCRIKASLFSVIHMDIIVRMSLEPTVLLVFGEYHWPFRTVHGMYSGTHVTTARSEHGW
jgi:hypothetical protein